ncbi:VanZ family protein [Brachybacterium halotolerans subsp. kimchii]|uniref:VanZ family protein n=1 Tax=Brachybacterium halotolerans TaxID=2795215 RepID=UPI001E539374|nr:VanZ family protein [Brachybacterium halotolerans]UEJ81118.1 VanZ family protein [Brachybacterium halotolerans subsp. kimchii]
MSRSSRPAHRPLPALGRACAAAVLLVYPLAAGVLLLSSDGWAINRANVRVWWIVTGIFGVRSLVSPEMFANLANVLLFVPFFGALALLVPRWWWLLLGIAGSVSVELYQSTLPSREASVVDVVTNTLGTALGVALGIAIRRRLDRRSADDAVG